MFGALAFHAVWQKKRESAQSLPLGFTATDELVNDNLCAIGEIAIQTEFGWACSTLAEQLDGDEDGAMIWADCDDADSSVGSSALDADCDGFTVALDCDDEDDASTHIGTDADCDGVLTDEDCDERAGGCLGGGVSLRDCKSP